MTQTNKTLPMWQVLICGALIVSLAMGIRHGFGLWMQPMTPTMGWGREDFAMAIAVQNISWGLIGVFSGMLADRFGAFRVIIVGALAYALSRTEVDFGVYSRSKSKHGLSTPDEQTIERMKHLPADRFVAETLDVFMDNVRRCRPLIGKRVWKPGPNAPKGVAP